MKSLLEELNSLFKGKAEFEINGDVLKITVGSKTVLISLPMIIGIDSMGQ